jgi:hypothetical protein
VTEYFRLKINALKDILILADILQLNKTTVIASCGWYKNNLENNLNIL